MPQLGLLPATFVLSLVTALLLTRGMIRWAVALGLVDYPSSRKVHVTPTPRGGGLAIFAAFALALLAAEAFIDSSSLRLLLLSAPVVLLGVIDDRRPLPWQLRLAAQLALAAVAARWGLGQAGWVAWVAATFWIAGLVNACNMLDNMDALSGGVAWIIGLALLAGSLLQGQNASALVPGWVYSPFLGALAGFLWYNRPPARIFMGDGGSTFLGFLLGTGSLQWGAHPDGPPWVLAALLCLCFVPWYDLATVVAIRLSQGRSPFHADKQHLSHRLVLRGFRPARAVGLIHLLTLASAAGGLVMYELTSQRQAAAWGGLLAVLACAFLVYDLRSLRLLGEQGKPAKETDHEQAQETQAH